MKRIVTATQQQTVSGLALARATVVTEDANMAETTVIDMTTVIDVMTEGEIAAETAMIETVIEVAMEVLLTRPPQTGRNCRSAPNS